MATSQHRTTGTATPAPHRRLSARSRRAGVLVAGLTALVVGLPLVPAGAAPTSARTERDEVAAKVEAIEKRVAEAEETLQRMTVEAEAAADAVLRTRVELRLGLGGRPLGALHGGLLLRQGLAGLVHLLGDDLEVVGDPGDQLRGLRGAGGLLGVCGGGARQERQGEGGGGSQDQPAGDDVGRAGAADGDREVAVELIDGMPQGRAGGRHGRRLSVLPQRPPTELADGFGLGRRRPNHCAPADRRAGELTPVLRWVPCSPWAPVRRVGRFGGERPRSPSCR